MPRPRNLLALAAAAVLSLAACTASDDGSPPSPTVGGTTPAEATERTAAPQPFDPLTISVVLASDRVESGDDLRSRLVVENRSDQTVTDPECRLATGRYALVPVDEPDTELWVRPQVDCQGSYEVRPGARERWRGPDFPAHTKHGDPLPPGDYLAVLEIDGLSERIEHPVTVE